MNNDEYDYECDCLRDVSVVRMLVEVGAVVTGAAGLLLALVFAIAIFIGVF